MDSLVDMVSNVKLSDSPPLELAEIQTQKKMKFSAGIVRISINFDREGEQKYELSRLTREVSLAHTSSPQLDIKLEMTTRFYSDSQLSEFTSIFIEIAGSIRFLTWSIKSTFESKQFASKISECLRSLQSVFSLQLTFFMLFSSEIQANTVAQSFKQLLNLRVLDISFIQSFLTVCKNGQKTGTILFNSAIQEIPSLQILNFLQFRPNSSEDTMKSKEFAMLYFGVVKTSEFSLFQLFQQQVENKGSFFILEIVIYLSNKITRHKELQLSFVEWQQFLNQFWEYCIEVPYLTRITTHNHYLVFPPAKQKDIVEKYLEEKRRIIVNLLVFTRDIIPELSYHPAFITADLYY